MKLIKSLVIIFFLAGISKTHSQPVYNQQKEQFIEQLMSKMTLKEKLGQLNLPVINGDVVSGISQNTGVAAKIAEGSVGGLFNIKGIDKIKAVQKIAVEKSRLKIPLIIGMDVIHGYETEFPIPLGLSATWDMELIKKTAQIAAKEASADGICWTFSPMVDISRDPRWGRVAEGGGEDPYLGSLIAAAMVEGYQGNLKSPNQILSCVKHFALYGASEAGLDYNTTDMSEQRMYNEYFPPYLAAVNAGAASIMASFNDINGVPATANKWLLTNVLRNQWHFNGFVVSDYTGISEMQNHGMGDLAKCGALALNAGVDMDMVSEVFINNGANLLQQNQVSLATINLACKRILSAKYDLGLFENPYKYCDDSRRSKDIFTPANRTFARQVASHSFVLLKNNQNTLPLKPNATVAVIGPLANNKVNMPGTWSVACKHDSSVAVLEGLKQVMGQTNNFLYALGCNIVETELMETRVTTFGKTFKRDNRPKEQILNEALETAAKADIIVFVGGESAEMSGESSSRSDISIPAIQQETLIKLKTLGKPIVLVLFTGRPLTLNWENENLDAILNVWFPGTEAGLAIADVLSGQVNPGGKLTMTFPRNVGQIPIYYAHKNTGRPLNGNWFQKFQANYLDVENSPLFPFGYGLSYANFEYGDLNLSSSTLTPQHNIIVKVPIKNNSNFDGYEVVQMYIHQQYRSITPPVKELKDFKKIWLKKGETKIVEFELSAKKLQFYNQELKLVSEPGMGEIMIGTNSENVKKISFEYKK
ncbi:MAG: beta-glucosidase BglX [Sediminibacterium sp.]|nr:beta-glucosidase BglX [Sediminibacterium sp.]